MWRSKSQVTNLIAYKDIHWKVWPGGDWRTRDHVSHLKGIYYSLAESHWYVVVLWSECYLPSSYVEILTPKVMVLGDGDFGRWLGHEGGALMNMISAL